ncbi:hypothetical protein DSO57_1030403 [Entomophthora muscae]|uniref:Uncharacterized protein n=1 Tax=Entomophthora muscae TaxID=34485 RepID=A0ACC2S376_9FUNG|nr:hypothetical protein DSO57_1030403 [Entomophthora muscae]
MLENLHFTIQGPVIDFPKFDIVLGLDWLQKNNPHVDWATSVLTIKREGVNHQIYPDSVCQGGNCSKVDSLKLDSLVLNKVASTRELSAAYVNLLVFLA